MIKSIKTRSSLILAIPLCVIALITMPACNQKKNTSQESMMEHSQQTDGSLQKKEDLLMGISEGICYSGFRTGQHPDRGDGAVNPSYEQTLEDLNLLSGRAGFKLIRIYDSDENSALILRVIKENNIPIKVLLGIWLRAELSNHETCAWLTEPIPEEELQANKKLNLLEIEKGIKLARAYPEIVVAVNVGNECLVDWNDHKVASDTIIAYVQKVKQAISQKVTVADNYKWWSEHGTALAKAVDFISIHTYPIWEGKAVHEGLSFSIENIMEVRKALPDSKIVITEAGWPSVASEFADRVSEEKQQRYYHDFMAWTKKNNVTTFWFEAFDEDWKGNPDNMLGAEKHWGLYTVDRKPKLVMKQQTNR